MSKQDGLLELVKSLNPSEKRYFKIFASRHVMGDGNQYMKIFKALEQQEEYDEAVLLQAMEGGEVKGSLARNKTYLKNLILKSLVAFNADSSIRNKVKDTLRTVEVLYNKGLGRQCQKQLDKAEKLALENEELILMLEILEWKGKILRILDLPEDIEAYYGEMDREMDKVMELIANRFAYNGLSLRLQLFGMSKGHGRSEEDAQTIQALLHHPLLSEEEMALSFDAKIRYNSLRAYFGINAFDYGQASAHIERSIELLESLPSRISEKPGLYLATLRNLVLVFRWKDDAAKARQWMDHLLQASPQWIGYKVTSKNVNEHFSNLISEMDLRKDLGESRKGLDAMDTFRPYLDKYQGNIHQQALIAYHYIAGILNFQETDYSAAIKHFTEVVNFPQISLREDLHCMTRLLTLLSHLELGNVDLLEYLVKSAIRFLKKRQRLYGLEKTLLDFISKDFLAAYATPGWQPALVRLKAQLEAVTQSPFENKALKYFDFIAYFQGRIEGRPMREVLLEKYRQDS